MVDVYKLAYDNIFQKLYIHIAFAYFTFEKRNSAARIELNFS